MAWWKEARLGLFIHWGLYAIPAGEWAGNQEKHPFLGTEWIMAYRKIPIADYKTLAGQFNPVQFDAEAWVLAAKNAGMKHIVLTSKHHDGFALFDSAVSDFNVVKATPFKRDIVAEMAEACQKHGLKLGLYYSQAQDWTHPGGAVSSFMKRWDSSHEGSFSDYVDKIAVPQVKEILSKYGPISVIWWDTPQDMTPELAAKFQEAIAAQPGIIQNSRLISSNPGDFRVFEGAIPFSGAPGTPWEACVMMNESWGYSRVHPHWATKESVIRQVVQTASLGGNLLLNVGPDATGSFPPEAVAILSGLGDWMKVHGEAIYGTTAFPVKTGWQQGRFTQKPGKVFAHVLLWPPNGKLRIPIQGPVKKLSLLSKPDQPLDFSVSEAGLTVDVSTVKPDEAATVFVLETDGKLTPTPSMPPLDPEKNGLFDLLPPYATFVGASGAKPAVSLGKREGTTLPLTGNPAEGFKIGGFASPGERVQWSVQIPAPGKYEVIAYAGLHKSVTSDVRIEVRANGQALQAKLPITGDAQTFKPLSVGSLSFDAPGVQQIDVSVDLQGAPVSTCNIWRFQLKPVAP
jgi:alpha-L-fucosidase